MQSTQSETRQVFYLTLSISTPADRGIKVRNRWMDIVYSLFCNVEATNRNFTRFDCIIELFFDDYLGHFPRFLIRVI